jgi:hypothetical protein
VTGGSRGPGCATSSGGRATTPERARRVYEVFQAALACDPAERGAVLDQQCGGDAALRGEVERLLARDAEAEGAGFLPPPGPPGGGEGGPRPFPLALRDLDVHIRCPHCRNPIELDGLPASGEVLCDLCGATLRLEAGSTTT